MRQSSLVRKPSAAITQRERHNHSLDQSEYKELLVKWAEENAAGKIKNSSGTSDAKDANSSKDANDANDVNTPNSADAARKAKDISDVMILTTLVTLMTPALRPTLTTPTLW